MTLYELIDGTTWSQKLLILRTIKGLKRAELAQEIGIHPDIYGGWERGEHKPQQLARRVLANYYGLTEKDIFGDMRGA